MIRHPAGTEATLEVISRARQGERLSAADGALLHSGAPTLELGAAAHDIRNRRVLPGRATYLVDRNLNYTNICVTDCQFCAFYRPPGDPESYVNSREVLGRKIEELQAMEGTRILMQGGHHPDLRLSWYEDLLRWISRTFPSIEIDAFSPSEIQHIAGIEGLTIEAILGRLIDCGLRGLPGGGAEILDDAVRTRISPKKQKTAEWLEVMRTAQRLGLVTTASMVIGFGETAEQRMSHLLRVRELQDESRSSHGNGFTAFIMWTAQFENTSLGVSRQRSVLGAGREEYLRHLAISRLMLDNFDHLQASWPTMGPEVAQESLRFGADDYGSTMLEENVVSAAGTTRTRMEAAEIRRRIRAAGFHPAQRDTRYRILREFPEEEPVEAAGR